MNKKYLIAIDIGGTKVHYGLFNNKFKILNDSKRPIKSTRNIFKDFTCIVNDLKSFLNKLSIKTTEIRCIGVCVPSVIDSETDTIIWTPNLKNWKNFNVRNFFDKEIGIPAFLSYDGHAAVLGEYSIHYKKEVKNMIFISIGTGIGSGLILDGKLFLGSHNLAGAIGWFINDKNEISEDKALVLGWLESKVSGKYLTGLVERGFSNDISKGRKILPTEFFELYKYKEENRKIKFIVEEMLDYLGMAISNIATLLDLDLVVIGGGVGSKMGFALDYLKRIVIRNSQPYITKDLKIRLSKTKNASLVGAVINAVEKADYKNCKILR
ncbi:MAG: ROK family protein [Actinobacteria bacterium]|nr:ROK family protein [Actinomycetota bacterium]